MYRRSRATRTTRRASRLHSGTSRRSSRRWRRNEPTFSVIFVVPKEKTMRRILIAIFATMVLTAVSTAGQVQKPLDIYFIDVEGGQATLFVSPSGESLLVDAGWPGFNGRDADRIAATARQAGVSRIDYLVVTHYHTDHVGGVPAIAAKLPIGTFVDH